MSSIIASSSLAAFLFMLADDCLFLFFERKFLFLPFGFPGAPA